MLSFTRYVPKMIILFEKNIYYFVEIWSVLVSLSNHSIKYFYMIYLFSVLQLDNGPIKSFSGCDIGTFFVKVSIVFNCHTSVNCCPCFLMITQWFSCLILQSKLSPDAGHILSGSSDGSAYVWQVSFFLMMILYPTLNRYMTMRYYLNTGRQTSRRSY